ncbi:MAG: hypothetical protein WCA92_19425 [Terriglobales bacterium]
MRPRWMKMIFIIPAAIVGIVLFIAIGGELVMHLWNWLLPSLFGLRLITFWQAVGILTLCRILFGRIGGRGFRGHGFRSRMSGRWHHMTPEEREKFRQGMRERCGFGPPATESKG